MRLVHIILQSERSIPYESVLLSNQREITRNRGIQVGFSHPMGDYIHGIPCSAKKSGKSHREFF